jgi:hypothetical protein
VNKAYKLLEEILTLLASERTQILNYVKTGVISPAADALHEANNALSAVAKIKRIEAMLDDVKSLMLEQST